MRQASRPGEVPGKTKVTVYIPDDLAEELRVDAARRRERVSAVVETAIRRELERRRAERERGGRAPA